MMLSNGLNLESLEYKGYKIELLRDVELNLFAILINGKNERDILDELLDKNDEDLITLNKEYLDKDEYVCEKNIPILDQIYNLI